jgi:hypothetical protein
MEIRSRAWGLVGLRALLFVEAADEGIYGLPCFEQA